MADGALGSLLMRKVLRFVSARPAGVGAASPRCATGSEQRPPPAPPPRPSPWGVQSGDFYGLGPGLELPRNLADSFKICSLLEDV